MEQGIIKAIFGHFLNTFDAQMKFWSLENILNTIIAQMYSKFHRIIPFQKFLVFILDLLLEKFQTSIFLKHLNVFFCVFIGIKLITVQ